MEVVYKRRFILLLGQMSPYGNCRMRIYDSARESITLACCMDVFFCSSRITALASKFCFPLPARRRTTFGVVAYTVTEGERIESLLRDGSKNFPSIYLWTGQVPVVRPVLNEILLFGQILRRLGVEHVFELPDFVKA